jgi:hypothetical protein
MTQTPAGAVRTTTVREVIPAKASSDIPDFWEYLEKISPSDWEHHTLYIYRDEPGPRNQIERIGQLANSNFLTVYNESGQAIEKLFLTGKEETEYAISRKWGGKSYQLMLKIGGAEQRLTSAKIYIASAPKFAFGSADTNAPRSGSGGPMVATVGDPTADVAKQAITTIAGQEHQAVLIGVNALNAAANVVKQFSENGAHGYGSGGDDMDRALKAAMVQRLLAPAPDPMQTISALITSLAPVITVLREMGVFGAGAMPNPMMSKVEKLLDVIVEKAISGTGTGNGQTSTMSQVVGMLPLVADRVGSALENWKAGMEAQRDAISIQARTMAAHPQLPAAAPAPGLTPAVPPQPTPKPQAVAEQPKNGKAMGAPSMEFIEAKIVEILQEQTPSADAADKVLEFLETIDEKPPQLVPWLYSLGEAGLFAFFQSRKNLAPALVNVPRVREFIQEFFKLLNEHAPEKQN